MAWWDEVLGLLKGEWKALGPGSDGSALEPPTVKQAQALLARTGRELADAKARAEAARRRMLRAQAQFNALSDQPDQHPRFRDRLSELANAVAHEGDMVASFDTHIATLAAVHDRIDAQLREFNRDVSMARAVLAANQATQAAAPVSLPKKSKTSDVGFEHARSDKVMEQLKRGPRSKGDG
jgi:chromosome segregation ATPase